MKEWGKESEGGQAGAHFRGREPGDRGKIGATMQEAKDHLVGLSQKGGEGGLERLTLSHFETTSKHSASCHAGGGWRPAAGQRGAAEKKGLAVKTAADNASSDTDT